MNQISLIANSETMLKLAHEVVDSDVSPDDFIVVCSYLLATTLQNLRDADDFNRSDRFEKLNEANKVVMNCAQALHNANHIVHYNTLQTLRTAVTLASIGLSPSEISMFNRSDDFVKTYIAVNPDTNLLKIGKSKNPASRMDGLKTGAAVKPTLLLVINRDVEKELHTRFSKLRTFGEWFRDDGSISAFIDEQKSK